VQPAFIHCYCSSMGDAYYPYDFAKGHPNAEELPAAELQAVLGRLSCSRNDDGADNNTNLAVLREALQYGRDEGSRDFLRQLSSFFGTPLPSGCGAVRRGGGGE